jgi:hypothetical protein
MTKEYFIEYRRKNAEKYRAACRKWYSKNKKSNTIKCQQWRKKNKKRYSEYINRYQARRRENPSFRLLIGCRGRIWKALKGINKSAQTQELLGCSIPELRTHLENQFKPGMTWENYGPVWHVDHRRPCASFNLTDREQQKACFHYSNLQPLFAKENIQKGART